MNKKSEIPVYYDDIKGWIALCDETLSLPILENLRSYVYRVNSQRLKGLTGEKYTRVLNALERLKNEGLSVMTNGKNGINMFQSDAKVKPERSFHFLGGN